MIAAETAPPTPERHFRGNYLVPCSAETDKKQWVSIDGRTILLNEANTKSHSLDPVKNQCAIMNGWAFVGAEAATNLVNKSGLLENEHLASTLNPLMTTTFNFFDMDSMMQDFVPRRSSDTQSITKVFHQVAREDRIPEMISFSQSIRTVAAAVFDNVRPLTDKERNYLRKFYRRVYKER